MFGSKSYVISVEGMMCQHCAAHVQKALSEIEGVSGVKVDLEKKSVAVKAKKEIGEDQFQAAIEKAGYQYKGLIA